MLYVTPPETISSNELFVVAVKLGNHDIGKFDIVFFFM